MRQIYISFDRSDHKIAGKIAGVLHRRGHHIAPQASRKPSSADLAAQIRHRIQRADVIVVLLSAAAFESRQIRFEHQLAKQLNKPIVLLRIRPLPATVKQPTRFIDFVDDPHAGMRQLIRALEARSSTRQVTTLSVLPTRITHHAQTAVRVLRTRPRLAALIGSLVLIPVIIISALLFLDRTSTSQVGVTETADQNTVVQPPSVAMSTTGSDVTREAEPARITLYEGEQPLAEATDAAEASSTNDIDQTTNIILRPADAEIAASLVTSWPGSTETDTPVLQAQFTVDPSSGEVPLTVTFTNESIGEIVAYEWDYDGDGSIDSTDQDPEGYTYTDEDLYTPTLTVISADGTRHSTNRLIIAETFDDDSDEPPPFAGFTIDPWNGEAPLTVTFTDESSGEINKYAWDFDGDGSIDSTSANPEPFTYTEPGSYSPTLIVMGPGGISPEEVQTVIVDPASGDFVTGDDELPPIASFSAEPTLGNAPLVVTFTDESFGVVTEYAWDFDGDGSIDSTAANPPAFTYEEPGLYDATLTVSGPGGISEPEITSIAVNPPDADGVSADFSASPTEGDAPLTVTFTNRSVGAIMGYRWDFDGGGVTDSTDEAPESYTYEQPGTYTVTLTVLGVNESDTVEQTIRVGGSATGEDAGLLTAEFSVEPGATGDAPFTVTLVNTSSGSITSYAWDFDGNGSTDSTQANPDAYTFTQPGSYLAQLTVFGVDGLSHAFSIPITVYAAPPPLASLSASVTYGTAPLTVSFSSQSSGAISSYAWDFDDNGSTDSTDPNPTYTFAQPGSFDVQLTVTGPGGTSSDSLPVVVAEAEPELLDEPTATPLPAPPTANFAASPQSGTAPLHVDFTNQSSGNISSYAWDFDGDGSTDSTSQNSPSYVYDDPGTYTVSLRVTGPGGSHTRSRTISVVSPPPPVADFTASPTSGTSPLTVTFTDQTSGSITSWRWDFDGDGSTDSTEQNPEPYVYTTAGEHNAALVVIDAYGTVSEPKVVTISVAAAPTATFTATVTSTALATVVPTDVATDVATVTAAATELPTATGTAISTASATPTDAATSSPSATATIAPSDVPTVTDAPTEVPPPTATPIPTDPPTATEAPTDVPPPTEPPEPTESEPEATREASRAE